MACIAVTTRLLHTSLRLRWHGHECAPGLYVVSMILLLGSSAYARVSMFSICAYPVFHFGSRAGGAIQG